MNSLSSAKMFGHGLVLISAVLLFHPDNALAAESEVDAQMQARDLLSGTVAGRAKTVDESPANPADGHQASSLDPQEQARQLILGKPKADDSNGRAAALGPKMNTAPAVSTRRTDDTYEDPQESARRMILGHGANAAAGSASGRSGSLTQQPPGIRLNNDAVRIASGLTAGRVPSNRCDGGISHR